MFGLDLQLQADDFTFVTLKALTQYHISHRLALSEFLVTLIDCGNGHVVFSWASWFDACSFCSDHSELKIRNGQTNSSAAQRDIHENWCIDGLGED